MAISTELEEYLGQGEVYLGYGQLDKAEECFRKVLQVEANNWFALNKMGVVLAREGELSTAIELLERALIEAPKQAHINIYCNLGNIYLQQKEVDKAIEYYQKAIELDPDSYQPMRNLAIAYKKRGQIKDFIYCLRRAKNLEHKEAKEKGYQSNLSYLWNIVNKKGNIPLAPLIMLIFTFIIIIYIIVIRY